MTGDDKSGKVDLLKSGGRLVVSEQARLLRDERLFDLRADASLICEQAPLRFLSSASSISSFYRGTNFVPQHT